MGVLKWFVQSGFRVALLFAVGVFVYHLLSEIRILRGSHPNFFQRLELTALNVMIRHRGSNAPKVWRVGVAAADEKSIRKFGRFPWSREVFADLTTKLTELGARAIAFDITFEQATTRSDTEVVQEIFGLAREHELFDLAKPLRDPKGVRPPLRGKLVKAAEGISALEEALEARASILGPDERFRDALKKSGRVVLGVVARAKVEAEVLGREAIQKELRQIGSSTIAEVVSIDPDGIILINPKSAEALEEGVYHRFYGVAPPTPMVAEAAAGLGTINAFPDADGVYRRVPLISTIKGSGVAIPTLALKAIEVAHLEEPAMIEIIGDNVGPQAVRVGDYWLETELGATYALDWYGPFDPKEMPIFSISDIMDGKVPKEAVQDKIMFVAVTAVGTYDQRVTPLGGSVPGIHVHATLAQNILDGRQLGRPKHVLAIELIIFLLIGVACGFLMPRRGIAGQVLIAVGLVGAWILFDRYVFFASGLVVYTVLPSLQVFLTLLGVVSWRFFVEERERRKTKQAFGRYLSLAVMEQVLDDPEEYLKLGGRRYDATVLFSDIRGFTTISEALSPEDLGTLLNRYMTPMTDIVFAHGGTLDKYIGDAVMAFWGAPLTQPDHAFRACKAALDMIQKVEALNEEFVAAGLPRIAIGIGLSTGPMTIGNMGSDDHFSYTALGDRVNLGARLEGQTKEYGVDIIISDACYEQVKDEVSCRELGALRVKGKLEPVRIYELIALDRLTGDAQAFVEAFHSGLAAFRDRQWDDAIGFFEAAQGLAGEAPDKSTEDYLDLCEEYKESPPPAGWDGVRTATTK